MTEERTSVEVATALVTDGNGKVLLTFKEAWGMFSLPMTRRRRGGEGKEPMSRAALRAATEALGVPTRVVDARPRRVPIRLESARQVTSKDYTYQVFRVEPHPDFDGRIPDRAGRLWLSPHRILSGEYEPISESARAILRSLLESLEIPARVQHTSVLVLRRDHPERGRQFLMRHHPRWGYALPATRWEPTGGSTPDGRRAAALIAAVRVAAEDLGLDDGVAVALTPVDGPELTTHRVSPTREAPAHGAATDYIHSLFHARLRIPDALRSDRALAWVTEEEIHRRWTAAADGEPGAPEGQPGPISRTAYDVLLHLGLIAEDIDPELEALAAGWIEEHTGGRAGR